MFKQILFIFLAVSLLLVAGCGSSEDSVEKEEVMEKPSDSIEKSDETLDSTTEEVNDLDLSDLDSLDEDLGLI